MRNETLANLTALGEEKIAMIRQVLQGKKLLDFDEGRPRDEVVASRPRQRGARHGAQTRSRTPDRSDPVGQTALSRRARRATDSEFDFQARHVALV